MAIKRGVSLYSYQQAQFFGQMDYRDMIREMRENLNCDGVEIINEATIPRYPFPTDEFLADWHNTIARYDMNPVALDCFLDTLRFRDHVMTVGEAAELLKTDIKLAAAMGFKHVRGMTALPNAVIERALDTAVKYDVKIAWEIHAPIPIKPDPSIKAMFCENPGTSVADLIEWVEKIGTKHVGLMPDMGIFGSAPPRVVLDYHLRQLEDRKLSDFVASRLDSQPLEAIIQQTDKDFPGKSDPLKRFLMFSGKIAEPEDLELIMPYILSIHSKIYQMTEIPGKPGQYEDKSIRYAEVIDVLKKNNWDGYICTEYEGQRSQQDRGKEFLADEVEEVRRHHEMLSRLIGE